MIGLSLKRERAFHRWIGCARRASVVGMRLRTRARHSGTVALLWLAQACSGGQTGDESTTHKPMADGGAAHGDLLDQLVRQTGNPNYDAATSLQDLVTRSERIATGTIAAIRRGPSIDVPADAGPSNPSRTAVMELRVAKVLKGDASRAFYVDFVVGSAEESFSGPPPSERVLFFLLPNDFRNNRILNPGDGFPAGEVLQVLTTPQGLWVETESGAQEVFERSDPSWHTPQMSFDDMVRAVEALVATD